MIVAHELGYRDMLRHVPFRVKDEADLDAGRRVLSIGMYMELKLHFGAGLHQAAGPVLENIRILRLHGRQITVGVNQARAHVVNHPAAFGRLDFDGLDISIFRQAGINDDVPPHVRAVGLDDKILRHRRNKFRRTDVPYVVIEFDWRRHISRIPSWRPRVDSFHKRGNLIIGEPAIILELVDANIGIDKPWRHHPRADPLFDRFSPRPNLFIRQ